jgi:23S rRNA (cytidine2498-2'-O)-methyltransferase
MNLNLNSYLPFIQTTYPFENLLLKHAICSVESSNPILAICKSDLADIINVNKLLNTEILKIKSINDAARQLKDRLKNWVHIENKNHRKSALIREKLPLTSFNPIKFLSPNYDFPLGHWTILDEDHLLVSTACSSSTPNGNFTFVEDKINPPSRAYLKLWEVFHRIGKIPDKNSVCIDLGASPGGWTWVLTKLTKEIIAIDKSPLCTEITGNRKIKFFKDDILNLKWLSHLKNSSWLFCDAALSPEKIVPIFTRIVDEYPHISFICTLKQKGTELTNETVKASQKVGTNVLCLSNNKHELTWVRIAPNTYFNI